MKHKKALTAEIAMWRKNAKEPDYGDYERLTMSEWPLCRSVNDNCNGCPVAERTGHTHCNHTPCLYSINVWKGYIDGDVDKATLSRSINRAADWLENEVLK